jgi:AbrB family looped-hinge helix DNA binding protein
MNAVRAHVDKQGRLVIPAEVRKSMGLGSDGGDVSLEVEEDGELRVTTLEAGIRRAQAIVRRHTKGRPGLLDEFLDDRRREAERD